MSVTAILLIVAVIAFIADAVGVSSRINLQSVGLAFLAGAFLVGAL